jgi:hypothetical protein
MNLRFPVVALGLLAPLASADTIIWTGAAGNGLWSTPANWNLNRTPNGFDDVVISTPGSDYVIIKNVAAAKTIVSSRPIQLEGFLGVKQSAAFNGGLLAYANIGSAVLQNDGQVTVGTFCNLFSCAISQVASPLASFTIKSDCVATIWDPSFQVNGGSFLNSGTLAIESSGFGLGSYAAGPLTVFQNQLGGTVIANEPCTISDVATCCDGDGVLVNLGQWTFSGGGSIDPEIGLYNLGTMSVGGGTLAVPNMGSILGGTLLEGTWNLFNGAQLASGAGDIFTIAPAAHVHLAGPGAHFDGLPRVSSIQGRLSVDSGCAFELAPYLLGTVVNEGMIGVGPASSITILGTYVQHPDGTLAIVIADGTPAGMGMFQSYLPLVLDGTLQLDFYDTELVQPGACFPVASIVPGGCCVEGTFDAIVAYPPMGVAFELDLQPAQAWACVEDPATACPGDLDDDGAVNGADVGLLLAAWGTPAADVDGDGTTDGADLGLVIAAWGTSCP